MKVLWISEGAEQFRAERSLGANGTAHLAVASLGDEGWDWHVWDTASRVPQRYGLGDTLNDAMTKAEAALADLVEQLGQAAKA